MLQEPANHRTTVHPDLEDEKSTPSTHSKKKKIPMDQSFFKKKGKFSFQFTRRVLHLQDDRFNTLLTIIPIVLFSTNHFH